MKHAFVFLSRGERQSEVRNGRARDATLGSRRRASIHINIKASSCIMRDAVGAGRDEQREESSANASTPNSASDEFNDELTTDRALNDACARILTRFIDARIRSAAYASLDDDEDDVAVLERAFKASARDACSEYERIYRDARCETTKAKRRRECRTHIGELLIAVVGESAPGLTTTKRLLEFFSASKTFSKRVEDATLRNGLEARMRRLHQLGVTIAPGAIAVEEAFDAVEADALLMRWGRRTERATETATRRLRRKYGARETAAGGVADGAETFDVDHRKGFDAVEEWLGGDDASSDGNESSSLDDLDEDAKTLLLEMEETNDERHDVGGVNEEDFVSEMSEDDVTDDDEDGAAYVDVRGAKVVGLEKDNEYLAREISALRDQTDEAIAARIRENVERTKYAADSEEGRRARLFQTFFDKYSRKDTTQNTHTGAFRREATSGNPRYNFFRGTEKKTRIEPHMKGVEYKGVESHVRERKKEEQARIKLAHATAM